MERLLVANEDVERLLEEADELLSEFEDEYGKISAGHEVVAGSTHLGLPDEDESTGVSMRVS